MHRTIVYLDSDLELRLKLEAKRRGRPMAELFREALRAYLGEAERVPPPPGGGSFRGGRSDTAERVDEVLDELDFGGGGA